MYLLWLDQQLICEFGKSQVLFDVLFIIRLFQSIQEGITESMTEVIDLFGKVLVKIKSLVVWVLFLDGSY